MSRTVYDLIREASWLHIKSEGFGVHKTLHVVHHTTQYGTFQRTAELRYTEGPIVLWFKAKEMHAEVLAETRAVAQVTKELKA